MKQGLTAFLLIALSIRAFGISPGNRFNGNECKVTDSYRIIHSHPHVNYVNAAAVYIYLFFPRLVV